MNKMCLHLPNGQIRKCRKGYSKAICMYLVKQNDHPLISETENKFFVETKTQAEQSKALQEMFSIVFWLLWKELIWKYFCHICLNFFPCIYLN